MGPMGLAGAMGAAGATGPAGAAGPMGPQGVPGATGPGGGVFGEEAARFAGFTTATYAGTGSSREQMHARCAAQFAGSHLCHASEYYLSNSATVPPAMPGAWIDTSAFTVESGSDAEHSNVVGDIRLGRYTGGSNSNCGNWTGSATLGYGLHVTGVSQTTCTSTLPLACCSTPYRERFRGFTAATVTGLRPGGRAEMNQLCGLELAGSHLCHQAEFGRTNSATTIPAGGAWIDRSAHLRTQGDAIPINEVASPLMGRYAGASGSNCSGWSTGGTLGYTITTLGMSQVQCNTTHPIACCE